MMCFHPRAHTGRDNSLCRITSSPIEFQSTRPHGARRRAERRERRLDERFNPRAHTGRDGQTIGLGAVDACFNPRAHTGRDSATSWQSAMCFGFNPRAHTGRDRNIVKTLEHVREVSIHAPTRGATSRAPCRYRCAACFNPRAHTGRDECAETLGADQIDVSIHAPTRGATAALLGCGSNHGLVSIHAPTRGATDAALSAQPGAQSFNPRAHTGRDTRGHLAAGNRVRFNPRAHTGRD